MQRFIVFTLSLLVAMAWFGCKEEFNDDDNQQGTTSQINENSDQYFIAEVEGVDGLTQLNLQDGENATFTRIHNQCPVTTPYVMLSVERDATEELVLLFTTETMPTAFTDGIAAGDYDIGLVPQEFGYVSMAWSKEEVNNPETGQSAAPLNSVNQPDQQFTITNIVEDEGVQYAEGTFSTTWYTGELSAALEFQVVNGIFRFRIE